MTTVLITGATSGIGRALAKRCAADGYELMLTARGPEGLRGVANTLGDVRVKTVAADLAAPDGADIIAAAIDGAGIEIDLLVNNAGAGLHGAFASTSLERELELVQLNVASVLRLTKRLLPGMLARRRGHVVNVASVAAFLPGPYQSVYYASKAFVLSFSEALGEELVGSGVCVTAVCPGPTFTHFHEAAGVRRARPLARAHFMTAEAVADAVLNAVRRRRRVVVPGLRNRLLVSALRMAPRRLVAWVSGRASQPAS